MTLPGVDKAAHMWGGVHDPGPTGADGDAMTHMDAATATADEQVGRIMAELEAQGELDNTLVVLTADHGSVAGRQHFHGEDVATQRLRLLQLVLRRRRERRVATTSRRTPCKPLIAGQRRPLLQRLDAVRCGSRTSRRQRSPRLPGSWRTMPDVTAV